MNDYTLEIVTWLDSAIINEQTDDLPKPNEIVTVGWLAKETDEYVVLVRDYHINDDSYRWRSSCAIPKFAITARAALLPQQQLSKAKSTDAPLTPNSRSTKDGE